MLPSGTTEDMGLSALATFNQTNGKDVGRADAGAASHTPLGGPSLSHSSPLKGRDGGWHRGTHLRQPPPGPLHVRLSSQGAGLRGPHLQL